MTTEPCAPTFNPWWTKPLACWASLVALVLGGLLLLGGLVQAEFGLLGQTDWRLPGAARMKVDTKAFKVRLPSWARGSVAEQWAVLRRDGKPIGMKVPHARTVVERGGGAYKLQREQLYFSLPKDEDARTVARELSLTLPRPVKPIVWIAGGILVALGGALAFANGRAKSICFHWMDKVGGLPAPVLVGGFFVFALAVAWGRLPAAATFNDGCFAVQGVPYSDASGWDELATNLAAGQGFTGGFSAQRPLYPVMLGLLYSITGPSLLVAHALSAVWLALAAAAMVALGLVCGTRVTGLAGALGVLLAPDYVHFSKLLLTEVPGMTFGVASVLALVLAIESPTRWRVVQASLLLACAALAGGFGLLALPGYGVVALVTWWRREGFKRSLKYSLLLAGVVALAWMPWLVRQRVVHGIWNLSTSSAVPMFAAAAPEHGKFDAVAASAWQVANVPNEEGARYRFYMDKYAEAVKANPQAYVQTVFRGMAEFADFWAFDGTARFGVALLGLAVCGVFLLRNQRWWAVVPAVAVVLSLCFVLRGEKATVMWPLATALVLVFCEPRKRPSWLVVTVTVFSVAVLAGLTAGSLSRRMWTACDWAMPLLIVAGASGAMKALASGVERLARRFRPAWPPTEPALREPGFRERLPHGIGAVLTGVLLAHAALGSVVITVIQVVTPKPNEQPQWTVSGTTRADAKARAAAQYPFLKEASATADLWVEPVQFGEYVCELRAWEDVQQWARGFAVRPYLRSVAFAKVFTRSGLVTCQLRAPASDIPRGVPMLLIGVQNYDPVAHLGHDLLMIEVLGWVPLASPNYPAVPLWERAVWLPSTRESVELMRGQR
ncbi:MAG: hypothetical protein ACOYMN_07400 [Roseimicrobium sp.]